MLTAFGDLPNNDVGRFLLLLRVRVRGLIGGMRVIRLC